jgi:DNA recombination protein RmuC
VGELQQSATSDLERRRKAVDDLVLPIQEALARVDGKLHEVEKERIASYAGLIEQVSAMARTQQALQAETGNLVKALRAPQVRGRWGEIQLRRVVEMAGMLDYCDFEEQATVAADGGWLRPDLVVRLPGGKTVVVDAKAPMAAYLDAVDGALDDGAREGLLRDHDLLQRGLPARPLAHRVRREPERDPRQPDDPGRQLHERIGTMAGHFDDLRRGLDRAVESYNKAMGSLETRVLTSARRFKELGVTSDELAAVPLIEQTTR